MRKKASRKSKSLVEVLPDYRSYTLGCTVPAAQEIPRCSLLLLDTMMYFSIPRKLGDLGYQISASRLLRDRNFRPLEDSGIYNLYFCIYIYIFTWVAIGHTIDHLNDVK